MAKSQKPFEEIAHSGGKITFTLSRNEAGGQQFSVRIENSRPVAAGWFGIYALPQGIPVETIKMGGIGQPWNQPPVGGCFPVFIASDSHGKYGRLCHACGGYWRSEWVSVCPYCGINGKPHNFLTEAQMRYVEHYCRTLSDALDTVQAGEVIIDMDEIADAIASGGEKPNFYYAEESQQNQYACNQCSAFNDILGKVGYCTGCGTRNDLEAFKSDIAAIREDINSGHSYERCLQAIVSKFDSFVRQYVKELLRIPLSKRRQGLLEGKVNHDLERTAEALKDAFDIDILKRLKQSQREFCAKMFHRRHVYEHNGGEVDEVYLKATGDDVRLKQALSETQDSVNQLATYVLKMAEELHKGFHEIFPPLDEPIKANQDRLQRTKRS